MKTLRDYVTSLLSDQNKSKVDLANFLEITPQSLNSILIGKNPRRLTLKKISQFLNIPLVQLETALKDINMGKEPTLKNLNTEEQTVKPIEYQSNFIELPYVPAACRATFAETYTNQNIMETFTVLAEPGERYEKDIVFEVNGDSMEPYYYDKMKVRARLVDISEWEYINSGVFIVAYRNNLVIKRIKNNDLLSAGYLTLHSDNTQLGGSQIVPKKEIQRIWKVIRIVDAPVR